MKGNGKMDEKKVEKNVLKGAKLLRGIKFGQLGGEEVVKTTDSVMGDKDEVKKTKKELKDGFPAYFFYKKTSKRCLPDTGEDLSMSGRCYY